MDDLLFPCGINAVDVDRALLHNVKAFRAISFAEKIIAFPEMFENDERCDRRDVGCGQSHEKLATAQRIFSDRLPEFFRFHRHAGKLSVGKLVVPSKITRSSTLHWKQRVSRKTADVLSMLE